jgi:CheY-like chemotaxis protein
MLGRHSELARDRAQFLSSRGMRVIFPENRQAAVAAVRGGGYEVVVMSYSLSDRTTKELAEFIEQVCPQCPIISITEQRWSDRELRPDATVLATDPPQALLDTIHRSRLRHDPKFGPQPLGDSG